MDHFNKTVIYYSGFWYSSYLPIADNIMNTKKLADELRLLSLIFDVIYVPRSHLLTFHTRPHWESVKSYFSNNSDFDYLINNNILLSSSLPNIDNYGDTERIIERVSNNNWSEYIDNNFTKIIKNIKAIEINSKKESQSNIDLFENYIHDVKMINGKLGETINEIKKKSIYNDTPFLHEKFIEEILKSDQISLYDKKDIWYKTNSIYLSSSGLDLVDRKIVFNSNIEYKEDKNVLIDATNDSLQRDLYSPEFIKSIFVEEMGENYLDKFLTERIDKIMKFRELTVWRNFKLEIFTMLETINRFRRLKTEGYLLTSNEKRISDYKKFIIKEDKYGIISFIIDLIGNAGDLVDPNTGKVIGAGKKMLSELLIKLYGDYQISKKMENFKPFWREMKNIL